MVQKDLSRGEGALSDSESSYSVFFVIPGLLFHKSQNLEKSKQGEITEISRSKLLCMAISRVYFCFREIPVVWVFTVGIQY